jgi:hypothetical protein
VSTLFPTHHVFLANAVLARRLCLSRAKEKVDAGTHEAHSINAAWCEMESNEIELEKYFPTGGFALEAAESIQQVVCSHNPQSTTPITAVW